MVCVVLVKICAGLVILNSQNAFTFMLAIFKRYNPWQSIQAEDVCVFMQGLDKVLAAINCAKLRRLWSAILLRCLISFGDHSPLAAHQS